MEKKNMTSTSRLEHCCDETGPERVLSTTKTGRMRWKLLWMKFKKHKKKFFESAGKQQVTYDPYTYQQNFDQGPAWTEADDVSRSFSARFADPSRVFVK